jgi:hypothetical protein
LPSDSYSASDFSISLASNRPIYSSFGAITIAPEAAALHARLARLWEERAALPSQQRAAVTERIAEIAREIAAGLC